MESGGERKLIRPLGADGLPSGTSATCQQIAGPVTAANSASVSMVLNHNSGTLIAVNAAPIDGGYQFYHNGSPIAAAWAVSKVNGESYGHTASIMMATGTFYSGDTVRIDVSSGANSWISSLYLFG